MEILIGVIGILVLVEACRRVVGIPILIVASCFVIYAFASGKTLKTVIYNLYYTTGGVIGTPIGVCSTYIVLFIIFGAFLEATGISEFFIQAANSLRLAARQRLRLSRAPSAAWFPAARLRTRLRPVA